MQAKVLFLAAALLFGAVACSLSNQTENPSPTPTWLPPLARVIDLEPEAIVIPIPIDPPSFNAYINDTGYEELIGELVFGALAEIGPDGQYYPELATEVPTLENGGLSEDGLTVAQRSAGETPGSDTQVYVADTLGELGLFFRLADVVFMGKSLVPLGGQNPLEPARIGRPVLFGPHMGNFEEMAARMKAAGAAREVADENGLGDALGVLLQDAKERERLASAALGFGESEAGVMDAVMGALETWLPGKEQGDARA